MKKILLLAAAMASQLTITPVLSAGPVQLRYNLTPGQEWKGILTQQSENDAATGNKVRNSKTVVAYTVQRGPEENWVSLEARILSTGKGSTLSRLDFSRITYFADMNRSGDIRNIRYSGDVMPDLGEDAQQIPPQTLAMMQQSLKMLPEFWKYTAYWFPELPEEGLEVGDEFYCDRKMSMNNLGTSAQTQAVVKQVYTLEEVGNGLAYFSVEERASTQSDAAMGTGARTRQAGRGDAVFDLEAGMWLELTEKSKAGIDMDGLSGADGRDRQMTLVRKFEMAPK